MINENIRRQYLDRIEDIEDKAWDELDVDEKFVLNAISVRNFWEFVDGTQSEALASLTVSYGDADEKKLVRGYLRASWVRPCTPMRSSKAIRVEFLENKKARVIITDGDTSSVGEYPLPDVKKMVDSLFMLM